MAASLLSRLEIRPLFVDEDERAAAWPTLEEVEIREYAFLDDRVYPFDSFVNALVPAGFRFGYEMSVPC